VGCFAPKNTAKKSARPHHFCCKAGRRAHPPPPSFNQPPIVKYGRRAPPPLALPNLPPLLPYKNRTALSQHKLTPEYLRRAHLSKYLKLLPFCTRIPSTFLSALFFGHSIHPPVLIGPKDTPSSGLLPNTCLHAKLPVCRSSQHPSRFAIQPLTIALTSRFAIADTSRGFQYKATTRSISLKTTARARTRSVCSMP